MMGGRTWEQWITKYEGSHQNSANRFCHLIGIPIIAVSIPLFLICIFRPHLWWIPTSMFVLGWIFQFVGHGIEGKPPEFLSDARFLFVGLRWWWAKVNGRA